jgi:hypothetical protein
MRAGTERVTEIVATGITPHNCPEPGNLGSAAICC